jgi:hypothetical protein
MPFVIAFVMFGNQGETFGNLTHGERISSAFKKKQLAPFEQKLTRYDFIILDSNSI